MGGNDFGLRDAGSWDDDPARKLGSSNDGGGADTWNIGNPWNDDDASSDGGGSWDDNSGGSDDDWT